MIMTEPVTADSAQERKPGTDPIAADSALMETIMDIGVEMLRTGAETWRTEDSLYRLADSYGFTKCYFWVVPSNIQGTVTCPDGNCVTQIRNIKNTGLDFSRLQDLNSLSRYACKEKPRMEQMREKLEEIIHAKEQPVWLNYLSGVIAGTGFGVFFQCDLLDAAVCACASLLITYLGRRLRKRESNPLILNFIISFLAELFIVGCVSMGFGHHIGYITIGVVMLMISALGATNGIRDMVHLDTLSGAINLTQSLTGASGIALGMALPLLLFKISDMNEIVSMSGDTWWLQLLSCTAGCVGFSFWFRVKPRNVIACAIGACLTWGAYLVFRELLESRFTAVIAATVVCALYAQVMARSLKAPSTIFQTISIFPLIPGSSLYYMMYGFLVRDMSLAGEKAIELIVTCLGIVLGMMIVEVIVRHIIEKKKTT